MPVSVPNITLTCWLLCVAPLLLEAQTKDQEISQFAFGISFLTIGDQRAVFQFEPTDRPAYEVRTRHNWRHYPTVFLHPRFNLWKWRNQPAGLSLSLPVALSFFGEISVNPPPFAEKKSFLITNLPVLLEFAIGQKAFAHAKNARQIGGFAAIGGSWLRASGRVGNFNSKGVHAQLGLRKGFDKYTLEISYGVTLRGNKRLSPQTSTWQPTDDKISHALNLGLYFR